MIQAVSGYDGLNLCCYLIVMYVESEANVSKNNFKWELWETNTLNDSLTLTLSHFTWLVCIYMALRVCQSHGSRI